jgi:hypothetical protein
MLAPVFLFTTGSARACPGTGTDSVATQKRGDREKTEQEAGSGGEGTARSGLKRLVQTVSGDAHCGQGDTKAIMPRHPG